MGSSETESGLVDCSVGSIVWVRRRNGSWWPGKILGADELSASHLMSPRSGTPVKLLGREDASVDWYNLEKSKRVKAFRCGEFDDCIERAEASQGMPPKKREKYARREDAILHALELERQFLDKKCGGLSYSSTAKSNKASDDLVRREALTASEPLENGNGRHIESKSHQVSNRSGFLLEYKSTCNFLSTEGPKDQNKLSGDGDNFGVPPRMRGLQDFGPSTSPPVHTHPPSIASVGADQPVHIHPPIASDGADQPVLDSSARAVPDGIYNTECLVNTESKSLLKKSTPLEEGLVEEILAKRRDRRRPLAQVLESSENLPVSVPPPDSVSVFIPEVGEELSRVASPAKKSRYNYLAGEPRDSLNVGESHPLSTLKHEDDCPRPAASREQTALCEQNVSGSTEFTESDSSETDSLESDTDDDLATLSDGAASIELEPKYTGRSEAQQEHGSMSSDELDELTLADGTSHPCHQESVSGSFGVSKWQLKGKRNNRSVNKRLLDPFVGNLARRTCHLTNFNENGITGRLQDDLVKQRRVQVADFGSSAPVSAGRNMFNWGDWDQPTSKGCWEESKEYFDPVNSYHHSGGRTMLIDVDLKVQSSYQREHVPMISLRSKINGQAIVGHPIQVEALSNGTSESLLEAIDYNFGETFDYDTALQPTWRTARRTASVRGRRPHVANALGSPKGVKHVQGFDRNKKVPKASVEGFVEKGSVIKKSISRPPIEKTFSRKPGKKISLSSYQKTRTLSSIASQQKHSDPKCSSKVDGAIKPETLPTVVACIPVKLVFSRLNEELVGRHQ